MTLKKKKKTSTWLCRLIITITVKGSRRKTVCPWTVERYRLIPQQVHTWGRERRERERKSSEGHGHMAAREKARLVMLQPAQSEFPVRKLCDNKKVRAAIKHTYRPGPVHQEPERYRERHEGMRTHLHRAVHCSGEEAPPRDCQGCDAALMPQQGLGADHVVHAPYLR